jgi:KAT8 regulatory NSL complex subunit 1
LRFLLSLFHTHHLHDITKISLGKKCRSKRAAFKYAKDRGAVASRWCWLATQISELDYKIRQLTDMKKHVRETKSAVMLEVTGFEGQLPGNSNPSRLYNVDSESEMEGDGMTSARTRAFISTSFKKRKLVQILNLHQASKKSARPR